MDGDSRRRQLIDGVLHDLPLAGVDVVLPFQHAQPGSGVDVGGDDMPTCDVQEINRPASHLRELDRRVERIVGRVR